MQREGSSGGWDRYDAAIVVAAVIATIFVHPVHRMLSHPFWLDEAWVAVLTRAPLRSLPRLSSSAPIGFVALLRLVPGSGLQRGRLLVLGFSAMTVVAAYVLARTLEWERRAVARFAATVTALVVMFSPFSLIRNDLKQYTCDAFCALVLLTLGGRVDRTPSRRSLAALAIASVLVAPFSSTALFVSVAVFGGLLASAAWSRDRRRAVEILVAGGATGVVLAAYFVVVVSPNLNGKLHTYWAQYYLSGSPQHMVHVSWTRLDDLGRYLAMPTAVFVGLFGIGLVVLVRMRARALAVGIALLWVEMALMGRLERYPFLDLRTSHFLLVSSIVVVALGAVGIVEAARHLPVGGPVAGWGASALIGGVLAVLFTMRFVPHIRELHIPPEDVRSETLVVAGERHEGDVILVDESANFGFSYYWPHGHVVFHHDDSGQGFGAQVADLDAIYVPARTDVAVVGALHAAVDRWRRAGGDARLYIVRTHINSVEDPAWRRGFAELGLVPRVVRVGSEPLLVVDPPAS